MKALRIACDVGATNLRVALFDGGRIIRCSHAKTPHGGGAAEIIRTLVEKIGKAVPATGKIGGICVGVPALVDSRTGLVRESSNLPELVGLRLLPLLRKHFSVPLFVRNDAMLATLGEHRFGAGRGVRNMVYFTISTGIGGGIIAKGRLLAGARGHAGEMGELRVPDLAGDPMNPAKLEDVASGNAIARLASAVSSRAVAKEARAGEPSACRTIQNAATAIGFGVVNVLHVLNPELVVLGGGVMKSAGLILPIVRKTVARLAMVSSRVKIVRGALGDKAGLFGGAVLLEEHRPQLRVVRRRGRPARR